MNTITYENTSKKCQILIENDPKLKHLFDQVKSVTVKIDDDYYQSLLFTILSQQLSSKVATVIINRFLDYYEGNPLPEKIMMTKEESLRKIGLSYQKISYVKSLSQHLLDKTVDFSQIEMMTNQEINEMLMKVKGIGPWSIDMFLMFSLGREDVFSSLDLGLRNAVKKLYHDENLSQKEIEEISSKWEPYRSIVSHYLWHMLDQNGKK